MKVKDSPRVVQAFQALRNAMNSYHPISEPTWELLTGISYFDTVEKDGVLYPMNEIPQDFGYIYVGLIRAFIFSETGDEYNKIFFRENTFPGSMTSLLTQTPSRFEVSAIEKSELIRINFMEYRKLLYELEDLKLFHIHYMERNWLIDKEWRELSLVQENSTERYRRFLANYADLEPRLKQYHIASHLGITPTQLSRIRQSLKQR